MNRRSNLRFFLPALAATVLATLAAGLAGCNRDETPDETATSESTSATPPAATLPPGTASPATPAPGTVPGQPGTVTPASPPLDPSQLPAVVARINGQEIKKDKLIARAEGMRTQLAQRQGIDAPLTAELYREILDGMIAHDLLLQEAKQKGITITDAEADRMMQGFKRQFPSQEVFEKQLAANKMTEADLKAKMRNDDDSKVNKLIETVILPTVQVSEPEARAFYDQNLQRMKTPPRVHVRHILIGVAPQAPAADREAAKKKADSLLEQLENGGDFAQLAAQNSNDPGSAQRGGDLSWVVPSQTPPPFEAAAFALKKPNDLSKVVQTSFGYHIIQLVERQEEQTVPFEKAKNRIGQMLRDEKVKGALRAHVDQLKVKGKVETYL